jgi:peptidyl-prolyl cis-trans isomerase D
MLETLRDATKSWIAYIFIALLIVSFGVWGIADFLGAAPSNQIATVGSARLDPQDFARQFQLEKRRWERANNVERMSKAQIAEAKLHETALRNLIDNQAVELEARSIGLSADDAMVMDYLRGQKAFLDAAGNVDMARVRSIAQDNDMSPAMFFTRIKSDLIREQLMNTLVTGLTLPQGMYGALNHVRRERRIVDYLLLDPSRAGDIADPDQAALEKFYKENAKQFEKPETRAVTLLRISATELAKAETVTEEDIKRVYDQNANVYIVKEKRRFEQIRFKDETAAKNGAERLAAGEAFEAVAVLQGMKPSEIKIGEAAEGDPSIPADAFKAAINTPTAPIKGPFGWVILRATEITTPGSVKTLDEVREELREGIAKEKAKPKVIALSNSIDDTLGGGATLEEAAAKAGNGITAQKIPALTRDGKGANGEVVDGLPKDEEFMGQIFQGDTLRETSMNSDGEGGFYIARIDAITPAATPPLAQNREVALAAWRDKALTDKMKELADKLVARAEKGESLKSIGASLGIAPLNAPGIARGTKNEMFSEAMVDKVFATKLGGHFSGQVASGKSFIVGRVDRVDIHNDPVEAQITPYFNETVRQSLASDVTSAFMRVARERQGVTEPDAARWKLLLETN